MEGDLRIKLAPKDLVRLNDENLFTLLEDLQKASTNLFMEAWRRGLQKELAERGMQMKSELPI